ncbi:hypothetical protein B7463_g8593, partial [Scytalidium lignicola]
MRLLNTSDQTLRLFDDRRPNDNHFLSYAILSHTWSSEEVTLQEIQTANAKHGQSPSHRKIHACCDQAKATGFDWVWVDTCCIDKTNNVELSEAINSMFHYYKNAKVCYVYLDDVSHKDWDHVEPTANSDDMREFLQSRWFKRGWTLQELIAPSELLFFDKTWALIGNRLKYSVIVSKITGIPTAFLTSRHPSEASIAQRMSWAAPRETTRMEDIAYCLLGLFDVHIPLIYGEGSEKAFYRLQEEIIKHTDDQSIFAWGIGATSGHDEDISMLATSPQDFAKCGNVIPCSSYEPSTLKHFEMTKMELRIELPIWDSFIDGSHSIGILNCRLTHDFSHPIGILINLDHSQSQSGPRSGKRAHKAPRSYSEIHIKRSKMQVVSVATAKSSLLARQNPIIMELPPNVKIIEQIQSSWEYVVHEDKNHVCFEGQVLSAGAPVWNTVSVAALVAVDGADYGFDGDYNANAGVDRADQTNDRAVRHGSMRDATVDSNNGDVWRQCIYTIVGGGYVYGDGANNNRHRTGSARWSGVDGVKGLGGGHDDGGAAAKEEQGWGTHMDIDIDVGVYARVVETGEAE